jgi:hypothetical protein
MPFDIPTMEAAGWRTFDYTLLRGADGKPVLVSDEIIRDYVRYVTTCRRANADTLSFADWITAADDEAREVAAV